MKKTGKTVLLIALVVVVGLGALFGYSGLLQPYRDQRAAETLEERLNSGAYDAPVLGYEGRCAAVDQAGEEVTLTAAVDLPGQSDRSFDDVKDSLLQDLQRQAQEKGLTLPANWEEAVRVTEYRAHPAEKAQKGLAFSRPSVHNEVKF